ncbi:glycine--tRNA ligase beta subunit [Arenicella chitinivorans]|uniref:Glycine--tRNA ligase beta subunit n=1 Tax=Arenicella chitinivorans TaxID=1329800 RepID=A0A918RUM2_9GAMM|nr:glycine--tRNA ligase subunit beta [Arenicella chitinivorans]GHA11032.1 glycine--tRNA ligase beta subunit [Arenicella chitinivorans]
MSTQTLLIEIGTEELPPKALKSLSDAFTDGVLAGLLEAGLINADAKAQAEPFATPRRLALRVPDVASGQPDQQIERRGPAVKAAFDGDGNPTPAAQGFAKSCGLSVDQLTRIATDKGEWLAATITEVGKPLDSLLSEILDEAIKRLPIPKRMRWGDGSAEFVRPVKWVTLLHGASTVDLEVLGVQSSNTSRGHRFHSSGEIVISHADHYAQLLTEQGHIVPGFSERQAQIATQIAELAKSVNGTIEPDPALLDEVTGLVEYPNALLGSFDPEFLDVPQECLVSSMRDHQKYFHLTDQNGDLLPRFITVSNIVSKNPDQVRSGNEKVLRARLSDAQFFWQTDQKTTLAERVSRLEDVLFHVKLGSVHDKVTRIQALAGNLADSIKADREVAQRGAYLAKADLVSDMVGEFDELQGIMGHYYADRDGEPALVGDCIEQHYWPRFAGDQLPASGEAQAVALADKLDSLVGIYAAGEIPTGDKDPYGLRRAALSILRILIEKELALELPELVAQAADVYQQHQSFTVDSDTQEAIVDFIRGRLMAFYQTQDVDTSTINSVLACRPSSPLDFDARVSAVHAFSQVEEAQDLAAANKRISNILRKQAQPVSTEVNTDALADEAELALYTVLQALETECSALFAARDYQTGLAKLAQLRTPIDTFFDQVMVMTDDAQQQQNRLAVLQRIQNLFLNVADIARLQN